MPRCEGKLIKKHFKFDKKTIIILGNEAKGIRKNILNNSILLSHFHRMKLKVLIVTCSKLSRNDFNSLQVNIS